MLTGVAQAQGLASEIGLPSGLAQGFKASDEFPHRGALPLLRKKAGRYSETRAVEQTVR
jgi:hypothetical protein